jgi:hypothetical protein
LNRKTYTDTHIVGKANVPKALISKVKGTPVFEDIHPMVCKAMLYNCKTKNSHKTSYRPKGERISLLKLIKNHLKGTANLLLYFN